MKLVVFSLLTVCCLVSCAHRQVQATHQDKSQTAINGVAMPPNDISEQPLDANARIETPPGEDLNDQETDMAKLPVEFNEKVTTWIEYFQGQGRERMKTYLSRSSRYVPKMKEILKNEGLPEDLVYIALIESGFSSSAYSRAAAVGYWQFIRSTGRRYGLQQNYYVDERRDFIKSTEAASKYLKALYNLFGSWYLAIASYNVGENRIKNLVMTHYTRDFWELAQNRRLPKETENYLPKFLAARLIAKHPEKYGFNDVTFEPGLEFKEVPFSHGIDMRDFAKHTGMAYDELKALNPAFLRDVIPFRKGGAVVRVPSYFDDAMVVAALQKSKNNAKMQIAGQTEIYRIRSGDTLSHIAARFHTSIRALMALNNFTRRTTLYPGKKIKIPAKNYDAGGSSGRSRARATAAASTTAGPNAGEKSYEVQEGDSLYTIGKKFGISISQIRKRNNLGHKSLIRAGNVLIIPNTGSQRSVKKKFHVVRRGDTLSEIARKYDVNMSKLTTANHIRRRSNLAIGSKLVIPR